MSAPARWEYLRAIHGRPGGTRERASMSSVQSRATTASTPSGYSPSFLRARDRPSRRRCSSRWRIAVEKKRRKFTENLQPRRSRTAQGLTMDTGAQDRRAPEPGAVAGGSEDPSQLLPVRSHGKAVKEMHHDSTHRARNRHGDSEPLLAQGADLGGCPGPARGTQAACRRGGNRIRSTCGCVTDREPTAEGGGGPGGAPAWGRISTHGPLMITIALRFFVGGLLQDGRNSPRPSHGKNS
jgi:hypothetical protein